MYGGGTDRCVAIYDIRLEPQPSSDTRWSPSDNSLVALHLVPDAGLLWRLYLHRTGICNSCRNHLVDEIGYHHCQCNQGLYHIPRHAILAHCIYYERSGGLRLWFVARHWQCDWSGVCFSLCHYWGVKFVRWFTMAILVVCFADLIGLLSLHEWMHTILSYFGHHCIIC